MRLFYASFLGPGNREFYDSLVAGVISDVGGTIRPVPAGTQHLTIAFLGEVADGDLPACLQVLETAREIDAFDFTLGPPRILYARRSPRLVRVDLASASERVAMLQKHLYAGLVDCLPTPIAPPKPPHVTLARFRKNASREAARRVAESFSRREDPLAIRADRLAGVRLVESTLTPEGPIYESIGEARCRS